MRISLGCELTYEVAAPSVFILAEKFTSDPELRLRDSVAAFDNRYTRLSAPKGALKVSYEASLELQAHHAADPATIREIPIGRLPLRILPFLLPSRFCESDRLAQFAKQEFGKLLPARFVSCYAFGFQPPDFHAVFEAYLGGHWWLFDATREAALDSIVRIGTGRDAAEVSFATIYGESRPAGMRVWTIPAGGPPVSRERTNAAVRTA